MLLLYITAVFTSLDGQKPLNLKKQIIFYCYYHFFCSAIPHERFHFVKCITKSWISKRREGERKEKMNFGLWVCVICMQNAHKTKSDETMQSTDCGRQGDFSITNDNDDSIRLPSTKMNVNRMTNRHRLEEKKVRERSNDVLWVFLTRRRHHYFIARHDSADRKWMKPKNF